MHFNWHSEHMVVYGKCPAVDLSIGAIHFEYMAI